MNYYDAYENALLDMSRAQMERLFVSPYERELRRLMNRGYTEDEAERILTDEDENEKA